MTLCRNKSHLLKHEWIANLVRHLGGKVNTNGDTALIKLFEGCTNKTEFNSDSFKLLWNIEKNIEKYKLKKLMRRKEKLKEKVVEAVPDAERYYK